jgi:hypothetical protein
MIHNPRSGLRMLRFGAGLCSTDGPAQLAFDERKKLQVAQRAPIRAAAAKTFQLLLFAQRKRQEIGEVGRKFEHGPHADERVVAFLEMSLHARPWPIAGGCAQVRPHGIEGELMQCVLEWTPKLRHG